MSPGPVKDGNAESASRSGAAGRLHLLLILILAALACASSLRWARDNPMPLGRDEFAHLKAAVQFERVLDTDPAKFPLLLAGRKEGGYGHIVYPPLLFFTTALIKAPLPPGDDYVQSVLTLAPWILVLFLSLYLMGRALHSGTAGLLAVAIACLYPIVFKHFSVYSPYSMVIAPTALALFCLIRSRGFLSLGWSAAFGLSSAAAMLTYYTAAIFLAPPALAALIEGLLQRKGAVRGASRIRITNAAIACVLVLLPVLPYYTSEAVLMHVGKAVSLFLGKVTGSPGDFDLGSPEKMGFSHHLFYYVIVLIKRQMGPWMSLLFLASAVLFLRAKGSGRLVLFTAALLPLAAFTFISSKLVERTMPALPAFAVITAVGLCSLRRHWLRSAVFAPLAVLAAWPLVSGYADDLDRFTVEARAQRSYHTLVPAFQRLRAKIGSRADLGAGAFHTMFEYYHALAGFDGNVYTSSHDSEFYRLFGDLDIVTYVSADGSDPRWFDREYLEKRIEARKFYRPNELPVHLIDDVVASRPLFRLEGEAEIIGKHYLVYAKRDNQEDRTDSDRRDRSP